VVCAWAEVPERVPMKTAKTILVTGGSGFFGGILKNRLLDV
jgi:FlaA1/EpsC-like NDP-sugar epimerase